MAKVGEGDPRWIVQEKEDGRNVNSWHWEEKDITGWAKDHLKKLFLQKVHDENNITIEFNKADKLEGDVVINVRKGKLIYVYDLEVTLKWKADISGEKPVETKGSIDFNFNTEDHEDFEIACQFDSSPAPAVEGAIKPILRSKGFAFVKKQVLQFVTDMPNQNPYAGKSPVSAHKPAAKPAAAPASAPATATATATAAAPAASAAPTPASKGKSLSLTVEIPAPPQEVFSTLLDQGKLSAITQSAVTMSREVGASFSMFGGSVTGESILHDLENEKPLHIAALNPPHQIVQKWRSSSWPAGHFSVCTFNLSASGSHGTRVQLNQEGIPADDLDRTQHGWRALFFDRMRMLFGHVSIDS